MSNHVYTSIVFEKGLNKEQETILKSILDNGSICNYYLPMPESLNITSPQYTDEEKNIAILNIEKYGAKDWYDWKNRYYGTKWGDYDLEYNDEQLTLYYTSAWSPLSENIIEMFAKDFPNFTLRLEEEQGFGEEWLCEDGELMMVDEWDIPEYDEEDNY